MPHASSYSMLSLSFASVKGYVFKSVLVRNVIVNYREINMLLFELFFTHKRT